jgi:hypothetical protein
VREPSAVQAGKKLGVSGVDGESWFGLEIARRFRPGRKPPTEADQIDRTGQPGAPARQGASANYDSWRGPAGAERKSSDFSEPHPDFTFTFFYCSCVFMPEGFEVEVLIIQHSAFQSMCEPWPRTLEGFASDLPQCPSLCLHKDFWHHTAP